MLDLSESDWLDLERDLCSRSLVEFIKRAWHVLEPGQPYLHGWHMDLMGAHLEAVTNGEINRLLINVPPGTMKSMCVSVFWPAWEWGPKGLSHKRYIGASHEEGLATRDNMKMRHLVQSDWYQKLWPLQFTADQNEKKYFQNSATGWRQSCPVRSMTGKRGDCLTGNAIISTDQGGISIREIVESGDNFNVLSAEVDTGKLVYRRVQAVARRSADEIYRVHATCGSVVECTGDHRIYTARGYIQARLLSPGDVLMRAVRGGVEAECVRAQESHEGRAGRDVLQPFVLDKKPEHEQRENRAVLQCVQHQNTERPEAVLGRVPGDCKDAVASAGGYENTEVRLRALQPGISAENNSAGAAVLFSQVRQSIPFKSHQGRSESNVARWGGLEAVRLAELEAIPQGEDAGSGEGSSFVRQLRRNEAAMRSPPGHGYVKQHMGESGNAVPGLPCDVAQHQEDSAGQSSVAMVERISRTELVYDIQVEGTRCFFANGILVHNCVIWDDPHSVEDAHSPAALETANRIFRETLPTRLNNPDKSAIIIVMQRLNQADISGYILEHGLGYEHLCLPMEHEPHNRPAITYGKGDPRTEPGALLFPERFSRATVDRDKKIMGEYAVAGQFQQRPSPASGGVIKPDMIQIVDAIPAGVVDWCRGWDLASTTTGDYTAGVKLGRLADGRYIIADVVRDKLESHQRDALMKATAERDRTKQSIPQDPGQAGKSQVLAFAKLLAGHNLHFSPETGDKVTRATPLASQINVGNVVMLRGAWNTAFIDEARTFPAGSYDDQIDAAGRAFNALLRPQAGIFT